MLVLHFILQRLGPHKKVFFGSFIAGLISSFASLGIPLLLTGFTKGSLQPSDLANLFLLLFAAICASLASSWVLRRHGEAVANKLSNHLQLYYFRELQKLSPDRLSAQHSGYSLSLVNQVSSGVSRISIDILWIFTGILANVTLLIYFTATQSFGLTLLNLGLFFLFIMVSAYVAQNMTRLSAAMSEQNAIFTQYYVDFMVNISTIKRLGVQQFANSQLSQKARKSNAAIQDFQDAHANRWLILHAIYFTATFLTIGYLLYQIAQGSLPVSILILFLAFYGSIRGIIERVAENIIVFSETKERIQKLEGILGRATEPTNGQEPGSSWSAIRLRDIQYSYADNRMAIMIPEFVAHRGKKTSLQGASGQGKTTLMHLLANHTNPKQGSRMVDERSYDQIKPQWFTQSMAYVSQETELFNISLKENLTLGRQVRLGKLHKLLEDLGLKPWIESLDLGLDTVIGEKGVKLSAGQKQRINMARAILLDRDIYLLDEPTSHLDPKTEQQVIKVVQGYLKDKTVIIVTHREAITAICDHFYIMENHAVKLGKPSLTQP